MYSVRWLFVLLAAPLAAADVSFRNQVQPILARYGCSGGACHGAAAGQGGFKLSLRGYDDEGDYLTITRSAKGRRVCLEDPVRSLFLLKPAKLVAHKGGERFKADSPEFQILADWIASGAPGPQANDPRIERIEVSPPHVTLKSNQTQQIKVTAFFNDGHNEDVTRWVKYTAGNTSVATVDDNGLAKVTGHGEGTVTAWYLSKLSIATITVPYEDAPLAQAFDEFKPRNFIDERVKEKLRELNLPPSARCTDAEFIRRVFLDTIGVLPTAEETRAFLADAKAGKRDRLIDSLLRRPEFVDYWSYKWCDLFLVNSDKLPVQPMWSYYQWIRRNVELNTPWDEMVRDLLTSTGSTLENGAGNFFTLHDEPTRLAETVSTAFLGMSIQCAKCHNHPMEKWTNDQYFAFANLFSRVRAKNGGVTDERVVFASTEGDIVQPLTGKAQPPTPLDGKPIPLTSSEDRRITLANWLTVAGESVFLTRHHQSRLEELLCRRPGRSRGRSAHDESREQREAAERSRGLPREEPLRSEGADARHPAERDLPAQQRRPAAEQRRHPVLRQLLPAAVDRRGRARRRERRHRRAHELQHGQAQRQQGRRRQLPDGLPSAAASGLEHDQLFPQQLRPARPRADLRLRADQRAEHGPGAPYRERRHDEHQALREGQPGRKTARRAANRTRRSSTMPI